MPQHTCKVDGVKVVVRNKRECERMGGVVTDEGEKKPNDCPFVRNVLTRALGSLVLDIGRADRVSSGVVQALAIPSRRKSRGASRANRTVRLTSAKRRALAQAAGKAVLRLAPTYSTVLDFRDRLLLTTPRGREWKRYYDRHLSDIYKEAEGDLDLMNASATTWLAVYPFVRGMVGVAAGRRGSAGAVRFSPKLHQACVRLIRQFREQSDDRAFRKVLNELQRELAGYVGLSAEQAVARLKKSRSRRR